MPAKIVRKNFFDYLHEFFHDSRSIGILLLCSTCISLLLANMAGEGYTRFFEAGLTPALRFRLPHTAGHFINDGLMAVFFFLVGLEIKRELTGGELSSVRQAMLPVGAAIGGMIVPAFIFAVLNRGGAYQNGWGIPMATDIAFSLGLSSMLGNRFPASLKIFLTALAIIDDLGAIAVIAFFYGGSIKIAWLAGAALCLLVLWYLNYRHTRFNAVYVIAGLALWYFIYNSGIHATIAGVLFAFMVPKQELARLEHLLHKPMNFLILPLFALANTAIPIHLSLLAQLGTTLPAGIFSGLYFGKVTGIFFACRLMVRHKIAKLPPGISWAEIAWAGILAGIGFTMSIFIATLAFRESHLQNLAKLSILISALLSIITAFLWIPAIKKYRGKPHRIYEEDDFANLA